MQSLQETKSKCYILQTKSLLYIKRAIEINSTLTWIAETTALYKMIKPLTFIHVNVVCHRGQINDKTNIA